MGIPKFFRWISNRYPMISELIDEKRIPEFDNMYLDMNSILHACTHKDPDMDVTSRLTEQEMYLAIFNYIDLLFKKIKPKRLLYMAIDGVAPRAKMNQQRSRRFRSAKEAEEAREKAVKEGLEMPKEEPFDSNAITPGTEFMARVSDQLRYFIHKKLSEDADWQDTEIVFSGSNVPGEGEHKIMDYIRRSRAQPDYNPNTRHCLYGLDADLIMLGLLSHDPHFCLLREEVQFGPSRKKIRDVEDQSFFLLHLSLLREYLEIEFQDLKNTLPFAYDFERILDDYILINFFVGNDFLPNLPSLQINEGASVVVMDTYKRVLPRCDDYLNNNGQLNLKGFRLLLLELEQFEIGLFQSDNINLEIFNKRLERGEIKGVPALKRPKKSSNGLHITQRQMDLFQLIKPFALRELAGKFPKEDEPFIDLPTSISKDDLAFVQTLCRKIKLRTYPVPVAQGSGEREQQSYRVEIDYGAISEYEDDDEQEERYLELQKVLRQYEKAHVLHDSGINDENLPQLSEMDRIHLEERDAWKDSYYKDKFGFSLYDKDKIRDLAFNYVEGVQWVLLYYYQGVPSWSWYFRYHYAPRISDIKDGLPKDMSPIVFDQGKPFRPFEQLMAVLPARSGALIPSAYRKLMTDEKSEILDFYPHNFEEDLNGKKNSWEAVVKIPFVDEQRLLVALNKYENNLTPEEKSRNQFGKNLIFRYDPTRNVLFPSSLPGIFLDIENCNCYEEEYFLASMDGLEYQLGLNEGAHLGQNFLSGFATLTTIPFTAEIDYGKVLVFNQPSKDKSVLLTLKNIYADQTPEQIARERINKKVYVYWPFLREGFMTGISDDLFRYEFSIGYGGKSTVVQRPLDENERDKYQKNARKVIFDYSRRKGVRMEGVGPGETGQSQILAHVAPLKGLVLKDDGALVKDYDQSSDAELVFPIQCTVENVKHEDERLMERPAIPIQQEFPNGTKVIFLGEYSYGSSATVVDTKNNKLVLQMDKRHFPEPNIGQTVANEARRKDRYYPSYEVAQILNIHPLLLSKITSRFVINTEETKRLDFGLNLKFEAKKLKVLGYSRRNVNGWEFSERALRLIQDYKRQFPTFFQALSRNVQANNLSAAMLFPDIPEEEAIRSLVDVRRWVKGVTEEFESVSLNAEELDPEYVKKIQEATDLYFARYKLNNGQQQEQQQGAIKPIGNVPRTAVLKPSEAQYRLRKQTFRLGDRVEYCVEAGRIPVFTRGTVVGINHPEGSSTITLDVVFDDEFFGGTNLSHRCSDGRGETVEIGSVINLSMRQLVTESQASRNRHQQQQQQPVSRLNGSRGGRGGRFQQRQQQQQQQPRFGGGYQQPPPTAPRAIANGFSRGRGGGGGRGGASRGGRPANLVEYFGQPPSADANGSAGEASTTSASDTVAPATVAPPAPHQEGSLEALFAKARLVDSNQPDSSTTRENGDANVLENLFAKARTEYQGAATTVVPQQQGQAAPNSGDDHLKIAAQNLLAQLQGSSNNDGGGEGPAATVPVSHTNVNRQYPTNSRGGRGRGGVPRGGRGGTPFRGGRGGRGGIKYRGGRGGGGNDGT